MIAIAKSSRATNPQPEWHAGFLAMLPLIRQHARTAFRTASANTKEELIAEVVANAYCAVARLADRGKLGVAYPSALARYAVRHVRRGRKVGGELNIHDVSSRHAQLSNNISLDRLDRFDPANGGWQEVLVEDRKAGPAETAAARIDVAAWLKSLTLRNRRIARALARGEATAVVARKFGMSASRVSQLRHELRQSWEQFQCSAA